LLSKLENEGIEMINGPGRRRKYNQYQEVQTDKKGKRRKDNQKGRVCLPSEMGGERRVNAGKKKKANNKTGRERENTKSCHPWGTENSGRKRRVERLS